MIEDFQIKGLEKLVNNGSISNIYPMVDHIEIRHEDTGASGFGIDLDRIDVDIFLNDSNITSENMYDMELDPHYLVEKHLKQYFPYFDIKHAIIDFIVWGPEGDIIYSWDN
jgi:hypothetical protein